MTKDEYIEKITKYMADNDLERENGLTYLDGIQDAVALARQLDEPKKVIIPQFVADWIEEYSKWCSRLGIVNQIISNKAVENDGWLNSGDNQELLLNAITNGYEVEKEKKYRVKLPGMIGSNGQQYISKSMDDKLFACAYRDYLEQEFTKEELEEFPNWVQQLEFEVEDE
ncbi:DUF1642 domain-containing protein [Pediococcus pentosaceus]|uniref:DUF1642 domain-containing protein n=1 Tax=Pediococcus pentosaceus TaxID=1255 RepID=UPI00359442CC